VEGPDVRLPLLAAAAGIAALCLSIPIALLGRAVLAMPGQSELAAIDWPAAAQAHEQSSLFERAADGLLGADHPDEFFALVRGYRQAASGASGPTGVTSSANPVGLARLAREVGPVSERSQAHLMVGAVFALPAGRGSISFTRMRQITGGGRRLAQAAEEFRVAAVIDDRNESAKYDLELLLESQARSLPPRSTSRATTNVNRPSDQSKHAGDDVRHAPTRRRLHQGGIYGSGKGY
jgi:hypothetical protein